MQLAIKWAMTAMCAMMLVAPPPIECSGRQSYIINATTVWGNELEKCASGGDESRKISFNVANLDSMQPQLKYEELGASALVRAHGHLELLTSTGSEVSAQLRLGDFEDGDAYKSFSQTWRRATTSGLASQTVAISLTLRVHKEGPIELLSETYAYSMLAITCARANASVQYIQILN